MELLELQSLLYEALTNKDVGAINRLKPHLKGPKNLSQESVLGIYRGSVLGKLSRTLESIYPVCRRLVGDKFFAATATRYIRSYPSQSPDLGDYGEPFSLFLSSFEPAAALPYLPDVARLEWYWHRVFNDEDEPGLDLQALSAIPQEQWGELIFHLPRNGVFIESPYPIHRIWEVNQPDYEGEGQVSLDAGGVKIFLWRQGYDMRLELPNEDQWQLLRAFQLKLPFVVACERLSGIDVAALLPQFVQQGWIAGFSLDETPNL